jgi:hypothetical protein
MNNRTDQRPKSPQILLLGRLCRAQRHVLSTELSKTCPQPKYKRNSNAVCLWERKLQPQLQLIDPNEFKSPKQPFGALITDQRNNLAKSSPLVTGNTEKPPNFKSNCNKRPKLQQ